MPEGLDRIHLYFEEGAKQWPTNPELVISRHFYELWENVHSPAPFPFASPELSLFDTTLELADDTNHIGFFTWDAAEECCSLVIEGDTTSQRILLIFDDGAPRVEDQPVTFNEDMELSFGERLEVIYDMIACARVRGIAIDPDRMTRKEYMQLLELVESQYPPTTFKVMRQLPVGSVRRLMNKAAEDMAIDEISNQLILPLDGNYATQAVAKSASDDTTTAGAEAPMVDIPLPARTKWAVIRDLLFCQNALVCMIEYEGVNVLTFSGWEVLEKGERGVCVLKVPVGGVMNLSEGDRLQVYRRGETSPVARFLVEFFDQDYAIGRFFPADSRMNLAAETKLFARPRKSPTNFLLLLLTSFIETLRRDNRLQSPLLDAILGVESSFIPASTPAVDDLDGDLDQSQRLARCNAVDPKNPIVLIQGPPGTGKTHVLENVIRTLSAQGKRILVTAPSNTAVDNVCCRIFDLPVLRIGQDRKRIAPDVADNCWIGDGDVVQQFKRKRETFGSVYCGTQVGLLRDELITADLNKNGLYDVIIFDEAGMSSMVEFLLCAGFASRAVMFGDHQQLPPFPLPDAVIDALKQDGVVNRGQWSFLTDSCLRWLIDERGLYPYLLQCSYRCQNPRLMRFASTLFYNAQVRTSERAEYYRLSFEERRRTFPASTLRLYSTSSVPAAVRAEKLVVEGGRPGLENLLEARLACYVFANLASRYGIDEISVIAPYRRQVRLIRKILSEHYRESLGEDERIGDADWSRFLHTRVATVDSFQGGESDAVIICYVRSNAENGIGFVGDPNRINVAHTRSRREMAIIGDIACLKRQSDNEIFERLERTVQRDGEVICVRQELLAEIYPEYREVEEMVTPG